MHRRSIRQALVVVLFLVAAGAAAFAWNANRRLDALATGERTAASRFDRLVQAIAHFEAAQQAFDASQEPEAEWLARVRRLLAQIHTEGAGLVGAPASAAAAGTFADVTARVESAVARADENLRAGHDLMAADIVQDEGRPGAEAMRAAVLEWRAADAMAADATRAALLRQLWMVLGGTAAFWMVGVLLLAPRTAAATPAPVMAETVIEPADQLPLALSPPPAPQAPAPASGGSLDLSPAAALCEDIGRADTTESLDTLLARAASVIGASGVVIWLKGERHELVPVAASGYGTQAMTLLLSLPLGSENVTTAAWHSGQLQAVAADAHARGALAIPLFQGQRPTGVFTVELTQAADTPAARALASILAAQFGAAIAPKPEVPAGAGASLEATGS